MQENLYIVVYEGVGGKNSNVKGQRNWTAYQNEEAFKEHQKSTANQDLPIATGITNEEAIDLCKQTPLHVEIETAIRSSIYKGEIDPRRLEMHLSNLEHIRPEDVKRHRQSN